MFTMFVRTLLAQNRKTYSFYDVQPPLHTLPFVSHSLGPARSKDGGICPEKNQQCLEREALQGKPSQVVRQRHANLCTLGRRTASRAEKTHQNWKVPCLQLRCYLPICTHFKFQGSVPSRPMFWPWQKTLYSWEFNLCWGSVTHRIRLVFFCSVF